MSKIGFSFNYVFNIGALAQGEQGVIHIIDSVGCVNGITGLTQALAKELGPKGIRVNAVCPVYVQTKGLMGALAGRSSPTGGRNIKKYLKDFAKSQSSLNRLPSGEEIAQSCLFLASTAASAITGQCINVDCGVMPQ